MSRRAPAPITTRRAPRFPAGGLVPVAILALAAALGFRSLAPSPSTAGLPVPAEPLAPFAVRPGNLPRALGLADGAVPEGTTVFDGEVPAVANLDPALLSALRRAAADAEQRGVEFQVNGGWRSREYEDQLHEEAVAKYGSESEASRWVATADTSAHVSGDAVDLGGPDATAWLSAHGARYGLCQVYRNEPWHYELRPQAAAHGCPRMYADPTKDPRMQP